MEKSILISMRKVSAIAEDDTSFDEDLITHINSIFMVLMQLGVGPEEGFAIEDENATWSDFLANRKDLNAVKTYVSQKIKLIFDPPQMGYLVDSIKQQCTELEWRLAVQGEGHASYG